MQILAYGEDALTLWALQNNLPLILHALNDSSALTQCEAFFRPSFGRSGGERSSQFGEFDFILLAEHSLYLGESKWDKSSERIVDGVLTLREEQLLRHEIFKFYVEEWAFGSYRNWSEFIINAQPILRQKCINKPIAPEDSLLAANIQTVLSIIKQHYSSQPAIRNVLLYLYDRTFNNKAPQKAGTDFSVVPIDYSGGLFGNYVNISI